MKYTKTNENSFELQTFRKVMEMIDSDEFKVGVRDVVKVINLRGFFEINQDFYGTDDHILWSCDVKESLAKKHWFSVVDYLKEKISLYELHSDKDWVKKQIAKKFKILNQSEKFYWPLRYEFGKSCISFDIKKKDLIFTKRTEYGNIKCQLEQNTNKINVNSLVLLDFSFLDKSFVDLINLLDDELILLLFKNICGLLSDDDFADNLIIYVKNNLNNIIVDWALNNKSDVLELDSFPIDFYSTEFIAGFRSKKKYSDFFEKISDGAKNKKGFNFGLKPNFNKVKKYYKDFLIQMVDECVDLKTYPYNCVHQKKEVSFSDEQISELKSELIPLLEEIEKQGKIFFNIYENFSYHNVYSGSKNFIKQCCRSEGIIFELMNILDWYPKKFNFYNVIFTDGNFNKEISKYSHIKYASKAEGFDYHFYIELCKYNDNEKWPEKRFKQIQNIANKILGNSTIVITERGLDRKIPEPVNTARVNDFYNNSISKKYFSKK